MDVNSINIIKETHRRPEAVNNTAQRKAEAYKKQTEVMQKASEITEKELTDAIENSNEIGQMLKRKLNFSVDEGTDKVVVKVIDEESGDVVRQVPPKEMLRISAHLKKLQEMNNQVMHAVKSVILDVKC